MPLDLICAEYDIHDNDSGQEQTLEASGEDTKAQRRDSYFAVVAFAKKRCVDEMLLEISIGMTRLFKISLGIIVEAC